MQIQSTVFRFKMGFYPSGRCFILTSELLSVAIFLKSLSIGNQASGALMETARRTYEMRCCDVVGESLWNASAERRSISTANCGDVCQVNEVTRLLSLASQKQTNE